MTTIKASRLSNRLIETCILFVLLLSSVFHVNGQCPITCDNSSIVNNTDPMMGVSSACVVSSGVNAGDECGAFVINTTGGETITFDAGNGGSCSMGGISSVISLVSGVCNEMSTSGDVSGGVVNVPSGVTSITIFVCRSTGTGNVGLCDVSGICFDEADAGTNGSLSICEGETVTEAQLFVSLGGTPEMGGSWSPVLAGAGTYTYTIIGVDPCEDATAQVVVSEQASPDAGENGTLSICNGDTVTEAQLFGALNGTPEMGGSWSPVLAGAGTYTYTVSATAPCTNDDEAQVIVSEEDAPDPGTDGTLDVCEGDIVTDMQLFGALGGSPDMGGTWTPALAGAGTYTYTISSICPDVTAEVVVSEVAAPDAGQNGNLEICVGATVTTLELFSSLLGTPEMGGTWTPALAGAGTYTYTVLGNSPCPDATADVVVTEEDNIPPVCAIDADVNLYITSNSCDTTYIFNLPIPTDNCDLNPTAIAIPGEPASGDAFPIGTTTINYLISDAAGNIENCSFDIIVDGFEPGALACKNVNISVDENCNVFLSPTLFLTNDTLGCLDNYIITITDHHGNVVPNDDLDYHYLGQNLQYEICHSATNNCCWGNFNLEDKFPPQIICPTDSIRLSCYALDSYLPPVGDDNCYEDNVRVELIDEHIIDLDECDSEFKSKILRTFVSVDAYGATSQPCVVEIYLERVDLSEVDFPSDTVLYCDRVLETTDMGYPLPRPMTGSGTGVPTYPFNPITGSGTGPRINVPIYPNAPEFLCDTHVTYTDQEISTTDCKTKFMRTWVVTEWHCSQDTSYGDIQMIEVVDHIAPVLTPLDDITVTTSVHGCEAWIDLPAIQATDSCSDIHEVDIQWPTGAIEAQNGGSAHFPEGVSQVIYKVRDACYNEAQDTMYVTVKDLTQPTAACEQNTVVSIPYDGYIDVLAEVFDDGSNDECGLKDFYALRMNNDNCVCDYPEYDDMNLLGKLDGHLYYISDYKMNGHKAKKFSEAMGGHLVSINDTLENDWLYDATEDYFDNYSPIGNPDKRYWIGLHDTDVEGFYEWFNGDHSNYRNWRTGQPNGDGDYVMMTPFGDWNDFSVNTDLRFVMEIPDTCTYSKKVHFCCDDVGTEQMVFFRAVDQSGNYNDCMVRVHVQDKIQPQMTCPADTTIYCTANYDLNNLNIQFGLPTVIDNCNRASDVEEKVDENINSCNTGNIIRTFTIYDADSLIVSTCQQVITVHPEDAFDMDDIIWPLDITADTLCSDLDLKPENLDPPYDYPTWLEDECDLVGYNYSDERFDFIPGSDACFKIIRTWKVINWCQVLVNGEYAVDSFEQVIKINNTTAPRILTNCVDVDTFVSYDAACGDVLVDISAFASDDCTLTSELTWEFHLDLFNDNVIDQSGLTNSLLDSLPVGNHTITWVVFDKCGNTDSCEKSFFVNNKKTPTPVCINGLSTDLTPMDLDGNGVIETAMSELWASDFDAHSFHSCGYEVIVSFSSDPTDIYLQLDCGDVGIVPVELWVTDVVNLEQSFCTTFIQVTNNNPLSPCTAIGQPGTGGNTQSREVTGRIMQSETLASLLNVEVELSGAMDDMSMTDVEGEYAFDGVIVENDYLVAPGKDGDDLNGVSTLDLVLIQKHILGTLELDSPYKLIAADANSSESVSASDLVELRKLILGILPSFQNNTSWRFIDADYSFIDATNPWTFDLPETYEIEDLSDNMNIDFYGVKIGDVNTSAMPNMINNSELTSRSAPVRWNYENLNTNSIDIYTNINSVHGFQIEIDLGANSNDISLESDQIEIHDDQYVINDNILSISWSSEYPVSFNQDLALFTLNSTSDMTSLNIFNDRLSNEWYTGDLEVKEIVLDSDSDQSIVQTITNNPNPWNNSTTVEISSAKDEPAKVQVSSIDGRLLYESNVNLATGLNSIQLTNQDIQENGILIIEVITNNEIRSIKTLKIN